MFVVYVSWFISSLTTGELNFSKAAVVWWSDSSDVAKFTGSSLVKILVEYICGVHQITIATSGKVPVLRFPKWWLYELSIVERDLQRNMKNSPPSYEVTYLECFSNSGPPRRIFSVSQYLLYHIDFVYSLFWGSRKW